MENLNVYILEDDLFYAQMLSAQLRVQNIRSLIFSKAQSCIDMIKRNQPDILILDHNLDNITGLEVLNNTSNYLEGSSVIYLSAQEQFNVTLKALRNGATDYIEKGKNDFKQLQKVLKKIEKHTTKFTAPLNLNEYRLDTNFTQELM